MSKPIALSALDGSNPLAFLAALGTLRTLTLSSGSFLRMRWVRHGSWRPELSGLDNSEEQVSELVYKSLSVPTEQFEPLGDNITVPPELFANFVSQCEFNLTREDRRAADFATAFGSELCVQPRHENRIQYTDLCFITGSGHQHFLRFIQALKESVEVGHIRDALFGEWRKDKSNSMRWDPQDAAEYAMRWGDPSLDGASAVWGANLLAAEALPLFGSYPGRHRKLRTTGFRYEGEWPEFSWPIWTEYIGLDVVRSLLALTQLQEDQPDRTKLSAIGVQEVYRCTRVRIGKGANFKVSFRPSAAV